LNGAAEARLAESDSADTTPAYLTAAQLADLVQVDTTTVYRWASQEPSMPALRIRGVVRFPRERVLAWLEQHEQGQAKPRRKVGSGRMAVCTHAADLQSVALAAQVRGESEARLAMF